ncbi:hypothetical protein HUJ04_003956 [Dendroctonus ponderosae]|nr:hypothetical protein HUJ04_003956 [Dendroctonus ponderosae]
MNTGRIPLDNEINRKKNKTLNKAETKLYFQAEVLEEATMIITEVEEAAALEEALVLEAVMTMELVGADTEEAVALEEAADSEVAMMITVLEEVDMEAVVEEDMEEEAADLEVTTITMEVEAVDTEAVVEDMEEAEATEVVEEAVMEEEADMEEVGIGNSSTSKQILSSRVSININNLNTLSAYWKIYNLDCLLKHCLSVYFWFCVCIFRFNSSYL